MLSIVYHVLFLIVSLFILMKAIGYAFYEINTIKNKSGGLIFITFSILTVVFSNIMIWLS